MRIQFADTDLVSKKEGRPFRDGPELVVEAPIGLGLTQANFADPVEGIGSASAPTWGRGERASQVQQKGRVSAS